MKSGETDLRRVDLNLLVAFDALVSEHSVTRAAERIGVGQSAMSSTLARLRKLFDDPVLVRDGRGLVATPRAELLLAPVQRVLASVQQLLTSREHFDPASDEHTFKVLVVNYHLTYSFLRPLLARLEVEAPKVRLHIEPASDDVAQRLNRHDVDLLITPREAFPEHCRYPHHVLFSDRYVVVVDKDHPDVDGTITMEQFRTLPYLATLSGRSKSFLEEQLDVLGVTRNIEITAEFGIASFLLRGTRMITVLEERLAEALAEQAHLKLLPTPMPQLLRTTETMVWSQRTQDDPAHRWLRGQLVALAGQITDIG
jgi:DNA-binding transcriptional LysR family regulator